MGGGSSKITVMIDTAQSQMQFQVEKNITGAVLKRKILTEYYRSQKSIEVISLFFRNTIIADSSKLSELTTEKVMSIKSIRKITVKVKTRQSKQYQFQVEQSTTGEQLKLKIWKEYCQSLKVDTMSLMYQDKVILNSKKLSKLTRDLEVNIRQIKITEAENNYYQNMKGIDYISDEKGVARMKCGHWASKATLTGLIEGIISANGIEIRCPFSDENGLQCSKIWNFKDCKSLGLFTKQEIQKFQAGLTMNWIKGNTKKCPKCKSSVYKGALDTDRVVCSVCKYGDFCYVCLKQWIGGKNVCGNKNCPTLSDLVKNCPWDRIFKCTINQKVQQIKTPRYRMCPKCCKHTTCQECNSSFCWICLEFPKNGNWTCGSYIEYCGRVAPIQMK